MTSDRAGASGPGASSKTSARDELFETTLARITELRQHRRCDAVARDTHSATCSKDHLVRELSRSVIDQPHAIRLVADALVAPISGLKLRPKRPNGAFLFNGPTGVGKTSLAHALAEVVYGDREALITVDCSELGSQSAVSRLIGPPPGLVGYDRPASWLPTRVIARPKSVVLFDEIEKSGPELWNLLLQICDSGRLTDTRGNVSDFSQAIVIMTANIGAAEAARPSVGFASTRSHGRGPDLQVAVNRLLPPELLSRLDEVVTFEPLSRDSLRRIARCRADELSSNVASNGWHLVIDDAVIDLLVDGEVREQLGARYIERLLERQVLAELSGRRPGRYAAVIADGHIEWVERSEVAD